MRLALVCFYCLCVFVYVLYFIATMSFAGYFLPVLFCMLPMLISDSRFDLVWFRLSCDHGWIRSGSVNVRKQQQQQQLSSPMVWPYNYHTVVVVFFTLTDRASTIPSINNIRGCQSGTLSAGQNTVCDDHTCKKDAQEIHLCTSTCERVDYLFS